MLLTIRRIAIAGTITLVGINATHMTSRLATSVVETKTPAAAPANVATSVPETRMLAAPFYLPATSVPET